MLSSFFRLVLRTVSGLIWSSSVLVRLSSSGATPVCVITAEVADYASGSDGNDDDDDSYGDGDDNDEHGSDEVSAHDGVT